MNRKTLALGAAALALCGSVAGIAIAQQNSPAAERHRGPVTRAEVQARAAEMFARLDVNHDGKLDQTDRQARREARVEQRFERLDANKDGHIDKAEFTAAFQPHGGRGDGMDGRGWGGGMRHMGAMRRMAGLDANGDRAITRDEFIGGALKRFDAADANHDGTLTPEERRAAKQLRMGAMARPN